MFASQGVQLEDPDSSSEPCSQTDDDAASATRKRARPDDDVSGGGEEVPMADDDTGDAAMQREHAAADSEGIYTLAQCVFLLYLYFRIYWIWCNYCLTQSILSVSFNSRCAQDNLSMSCL